jgi:hypothetical protein
MYNAFQQFLQPIAWEKFFITGSFSKSSGKNSKLEADSIAAMGKTIYERNK